MLILKTFWSFRREYSSLQAVRNRFDFPRADEGGIILGMSENCGTQKQYDHRLRLLIQNTRDLELAVRPGVPRSTARGWLKQSRMDVVSIDVLDMDAEALQQEDLFLRRRVTRILTMLHLVVVVIKVAEFSFDRVRIPDGTRKQRLLRAIERTRTHLPLRDDDQRRLLAVKAHSIGRKALLELTTTETKVVLLPPKSPNLNAYMERWFRSLKSECLDRMIFFGRKSLENAVNGLVEC